MADPKVQLEIEANLRGLLQPVNDIIQLSTANLNKLLKPASSTLCLFQILQSSQFFELKQLAAILLRQKLGSHWLQLETKNRIVIKTMVLQLVVSEQNILVKKSISELIISMSRLELAADTWKELFPFLVELSSAQDPILNQIQLHVFESIFDNNTPINQHLDQIAQIFKKSLGDSQLAVRSAAVKAAGSAITSLLPPTKKALFLPLLSLIIENVKLFITSQTMNTDVISAFEIFMDLAESMSTTVVDYLMGICQLSFDMVNSNLDYSIKTSAVEFLDIIIKHKPGFFKKTGLLDKLLVVLYGLMTMDDDDTDENIYQAAGIAIRECGKKFKSKLVYSQALPLLDELQSSQDPNKRKATLAIIQQLSYGCKETMKDDMDRIVQYLVNGLKDQSQVVRQYSCVCVGILSQNLHPNIYKYTAVLFPLIFESINNQDDEYVLRCCFALEQFLFHLESSVLLPIMQNVLEKLGVLVQRTHTQVKEFAISAISALALATENNFEPYFDGVLKMIQPFFTSTDSSLSVLKANALDCLAAMVKTIPKDRFKTMVPDLIKMAYNDVQSKPGSEVIESCFSLYSHIFERFGEEVAEFCPLIHPQLVEAALSNEAVFKTRSGQQIQGIENDKQPKQQQQGEEEEEEEEDDGDVTGIQIYTPLLDVKTSAIHCLSVLATNLPKSYINYCSIVVPHIQDLIQYFHEDVRDETLILLQALLVTINHNNPPAKSWTIGDFNTPVSPNVIVLLDFSFNIYENIFNYEPEKSVVARAFECVSNTVKLLGPASIVPYLESVGTNIMKCFNSGLYCQTVNAEDTPDDLNMESDEEEEDQEDEEEDDDYIEDEDEDEDLRLIDLASEAIIQIATVSGPQFKVYLESSLPFLLKLTRNKVHHSMRSIVIGTIAETIKVLQTDFSSFFHKLFPLALKWIKEETDDMKQVSSYLLGILIQRCVVATQENYQQALQALVPLLMDQNPDTPVEVLDNTVGCLARIISANIAFVPELDKVLPLFFSKLPIRKELTEVEPVISSIVLLINHKPDLMAPFMSQILSIFAIDLQREKLEQNIKSQIIQNVRYLAEKHPAQIQQLISTLPEQKQVILHQHCRS